MCSTIGGTVCSCGQSHRRDLCWNEINPVWNLESRVAPQASPRRTLMMVSITAMFHQFLLLCRQYCACVRLTKHALSSMKWHNTGTLTILMLHSNYFTSNPLTCLFWSLFGLRKQEPSEIYEPVQITTSSASHSLLLFFFCLTATFRINALKIHHFALPFYYIQQQRHAGHCLISTSSLVLFTAVQEMLTKPLNQERISKLRGWNINSCPNEPYLFGETVECVLQVRGKQAQRGWNPATQRWLIRFNNHNKPAVFITMYI